MTWPLLTKPLKHLNYSHPVTDTPFFFFGQYNVCRHVTNYLFLNCFGRHNSKEEDEEEVVVVYDPAEHRHKMDDPNKPPQQGPSPKKPFNKQQRHQHQQTQDSPPQLQSGSQEEDTSKKKPRRKNDAPVYRPGARINIQGPVESQFPRGVPTLLDSVIGVVPTSNFNAALASLAPPGVGFPFPGKGGVAGGSGGASRPAGSDAMGNQGIRQHVETSTKTGVFHLSKAKLHEFPPELAKIVNALRSIDLSENRISLIPQNISAFVNLKHLNLSYNQIEVIPDQIGQLTKLETLSLANNRIKGVPATISHLQKLRDANLGSNALTSFPTVFSSLKYLTVLDLSHNRIPEVPPGVGGLQVVELILNQNQIRQVNSDLAKCPNLKTLRLQENTLELGGLPKEILSESPVSLLSLEGNLFDVKQLSDIEGYEQYMERYTSTKKKLT